MSPIETAPFAAICGMITDYVADSSQANGSFVLSSPGRAPLRITIPAGRLGGGAGGYVCVGVRAGVPNPLFDGFFTPNTSGYVDPGALPATVAVPTPLGLVVPQACAFVVTPLIGADQTEWKLDCGVANNNNARGTFGPALAAQGWSSCGAGAANEYWRKADVMLGVSESSLAPGDYPRITQKQRIAAPC